MPVDCPFSIAGGGPFYHLLGALHLRRANGTVRALWIAIALWLPLALSLLIHALLRGSVDRIAFDISVHTRILVSVPLVLWCDSVFAPQCRGAVLEIYDGQPQCRAALDQIIDREVQLRDLAWVEILLAIVALLGGQLVLWNIVGPTGFIHGEIAAVPSFNRFWYATTIVPLWQFLLLRWLWRWAIWTYVVVRISRLPLVALATHPDRAAGLACLSWPITGFAAFGLAVSATVSGAWATQLLTGRATFPQLLPTVVIYLAIAFVVACGPLLLFTKFLYGVRRATLLQYSGFARDYTSGFHAKWIVERSDYDHLLGAQDIQALNDLGGAFHVIEETRLTVFGMSKLVDLFLGVIIPLVPLAATVVPVEEILRRLGKTLLGGLPI